MVFGTKPQSCEARTLAAPAQYHQILLASWRIQIQEITHLEWYNTFAIFIDIFSHHLSLYGKELLWEFKQEDPYFKVDSLL